MKSPANSGTSVCEYTESRWSKDSWRSKPISQDIIYPDLLKLEFVASQIRALPSLVSPGAIEDARARLEEAAKGNAFVIQGGDCAESFDDVRGDIIRLKRTLLSRQRQVLEECFHKPVIEIARIAGQYAKPRSQKFEVLSDGSVITPFKGHNINSPDTQARTPDPRRLLVGYHLAATTLELIRMIEMEKLDPHLSATKSNSGYKPSQSIYTSHEALNLHLEAASTKGVYNISAEFLWIGERTRAIDGAHVEYMRGLRNPIGVKVGPTASATGLVDLMNILNPRKEIGKVTLITRLGEACVELVLPPLVEAVKRSGHQPLWMCDPCHGNTILTPSGTKTRLVATLVSEIQKTYAVHQHCGSFLGGLHLEQTGEDVTECLDVDNALVVAGSTTFPRYKSLCDPRLAADQAMKVVQDFSNFVQEFEKIIPIHHQRHESNVERLDLENTQNVPNQLGVAVAA
ncbi:class II DAHP synthetase family protein [Bisporella sp. PMI_857]|nr:class II DAHP synthetase family protein [Bisporella sp. PMI_857]